MIAAATNQFHNGSHRSGGNRMTKFLFAVAFVTLVLLAPSLRAQEKSQEKSAEKQKAEERTKLNIPVKVQLAFTELDGDKKVSSMPYSFIAVATDVNGRYEGTSIRNGVRIPVETDSKDQKISYMDIGSNVDCRTTVDDEGRFHLSVVFERSALYSASGEDKNISHPEGAPVIRSFRANENFILRDGQTSESVLSTDPFTGHVLRVSITLNVIK
jgi:hypothetical protein